MSIKAYSLFIICNLAIFNLYAGVDLNTPECQAFQKVVSGEREDLVSGLQTDQLMLSVNGEQAFSYDDGVYTLDKKHSLWSASKTITATLVGAAIEKGDLKIDDRLMKFFPMKLADPIQQFYYNQITIEHLISMSSGFLWDESYESDPVTSTFMGMLYGKGQPDMPQFALSQKLEITPGLKWNYSGGNSVILMAVLRKIYGHDHFPEDLLFKPLKLKTAFFEKDGSGNLVGSSYAYLTPQEMQQVGLLYLNDGVVDNVRILPVGWVKNAQIPADSLTRKDTLSNPAYVASEGVFSRRAFWLNKDVPAVKMEHEFKNSPSDMFFAAGHYGQLIIILPTQKMVITATGHNAEYWSKIDKLVAHSIACFYTKAPLPKETVFTKPTPDSKSSIFKNLKLGSGVLSKGYLQGILAKEICSCHYVSELPIKECLDRANLPMSLNLLNKLTRLTVDEKKEILTVAPKVLGAILSIESAHSKEASFDGEGCKLSP